MTDLAEAIAAEDQPGASFAALERLFDDTIGVKLFTLMELDRARGVARRTYSNMPEAYPVSGEKEMEPNAWTEIVEERRDTFVANDIEGIAAVFPDHPLIRSLGCESVLNLPVVIGGTVVGTVNCLHEAGHYAPERVAAAQTLRLASAATFLVARSMQKGA